MPVGALGHQHGRSAAVHGLGHCLRLGLFQHGLFHGLTLLIQRVKAGGDGARFVRIITGQKPAAERRIADAPARIDARAEHESEMERRDRFAEPRYVRKRRQAGILPCARHLHALDHEGPVHTLQRNHIADCCQGHEVKQRKQVRRRAVHAACPQHTRHIDKRQKDDTGGAKMALARQVVLAVGIDHSKGRRWQLTDKLVVIEHHDIGPGLARGIDGGGAVGPAIDGDDQARAAGDKVAHRLRIRAVAFKNAVGNVDFMGHAVMGEEPAHLGRRGRAVHVIVAKDGDALASHDGRRNAPRGHAHVRQAGRIGQQVTDRRFEETRRLVRLHTASCQHPRDDLADTKRLGNGECAVIVGRAQPVMPGLTGGRNLHAQKDAVAVRSHCCRFVHGRTMHAMALKQQGRRGMASAAALVSPVRAMLRTCRDPGDGP